MVAISIIFSALQAGADQLKCPKEYVSRENDSQKTGKYWIIPVPGSRYDVLNKSDVMATYTAISGKRAPDFECSFTYYYGERDMSGWPLIRDLQGKIIAPANCINSQGDKWNPTPKFWDYRNPEVTNTHPTEEEEVATRGYIVNADGSYVVKQYDEYGDAIFLDKEKRRFLVDPLFTYSLSYLIKEEESKLKGGVYGFKSYVLRDGTLGDHAGKLTLEAINFYFFMDPGKQVYLLLGRENQNGIKCTFRGGISPSI